MQISTADGGEGGDEEGEKDGKEEGGQGNEEGEKDGEQEGGGFEDADYPNESFGDEEYNPERDLEDNDNCKVQK